MATDNNDSTFEKLLTAILSEAVTNETTWETLHVGTEISDLREYVAALRRDLDTANARAQQAERIRKIYERYADYVETCNNLGDKPNSIRVWAKKRALNHLAERELIEYIDAQAIANAGAETEGAE